MILRTLAASRLPLHVRARLHSRVSVLLGDRGRVRRLRCPPRESRRHARRGVAGAHLAVLLANTSATDLFDIGENLGYSSAVSCVVDMFGPTDLVALAQTTVGQSILPALFGGPVGDPLDSARSASPINYVNRSEPPMLVVHGTRDAFVAYSESVSFTEAMTRANARYDFHTVTGGGHGTYGGFGSQGDRCI